MPVKKFTPLDLLPFQYQMGNMKWGRNCDLKLDPKGPQVQAPDDEKMIVPVIYGDGEIKGQRFLRGQTVNWDFNLTTKHDAALVTQPWKRADAVLADHIAAWEDEEVRLTPNLYMEIRYNRGRGIRRMIGWPEKFIPVYGKVTSGWVPVTAEFRKRDHLFYGETKSDIITSTDPSDGGAVWPLTWPVRWGEGGSTTGTKTFVIEGEAATPISFRIFGPRVRPKVFVGNEWWFELDLTLGQFDHIDIIPNFWDQGIIFNDNQDFDGVLTADSQWLPDMKLLPGAYPMILTGNDPTGRSYMEVSYDPAYKDM